MSILTPPPTKPNTAALPGMPSLFIRDEGSDTIIEELRTRWAFIQTKLTSGPASIDQIHAFLVKFSLGPRKFNRTKDELRLFMDVMLKEEKVVLENTLYKLNRKQ